MAVLTHTSAFTVATSLARVGSSFDFAGESVALVSDDSRTSLLAITPPADGYTNYLVVKNLATKVPMGSIIRGIQINVEGQDTDAADRTDIVDDAARLLQANALAGSSFVANFLLTPGEDAVVFFGGGSSLAGLTWMAGNGTSTDDINSTGFGFAVSYLIDQSSGGGDGIPAIDCITATISYELRLSSAFWLLLGALGDNT